MNEKEITSLLKLLEDPDIKVYNAIKIKIIQNSQVMFPLLEKYWQTSDCQIAHQRVEQIIDEIYLKDAIAGLQAWKTTNNPNFWTAVAIIEKYFERYDSPNSLENMLHRLYERIWIESSDNLTVLEKIKLINHFIFSVDKFKPQNPQNYTVNSVQLTSLLETKVYTNENLSLLYLILCKRLELPVSLLNIDFMGIPILGYYDKMIANAVLANTENDFVFYVLPAIKGEIWSQNQLVSYASEKDIIIDPKKIRCLSDSEVLKQWLLHKKQIYEKVAFDDFATENVKKLTDILD